MIRFALPDYTRNLDLNLTFARMMRGMPEMFPDDVAAECLYGCFPGCIMNGGRVVTGTLQL